MSKEWLGAGAYCPLELQKVKVGDTTGADKNYKSRFNQYFISSK